MTTSSSVARRYILYCFAAEDILDVLLAKMEEKDGQLEQDSAQKSFRIFELCSPLAMISTNCTLEYEFGL